jgi:hypothetical protein
MPKPQSLRQGWQVHEAESQQASGKAGEKRLLIFYDLVSRKTAPQQHRLVRVGPVSNSAWTNRMGTVAHCWCHGFIWNENSWRRVKVRVLLFKRESARR